MMAMVMDDALILLYNYYIVYYGSASDNRRFHSRVVMRRAEYTSNDSASRSNEHKICCDIPKVTYVSCGVKVRFADL
jgi:hypothetical protein